MCFLLHSFHTVTKAHALALIPFSVSQKLTSFTSNTDSNGENAIESRRFFGFAGRQEQTQDGLTKSTAGGNDRTASKRTGRTYCTRLWSLTPVGGDYCDPENKLEQQDQVVRRVFDARLASALPKSKQIGSPRAFL